MLTLGSNYSDNLSLRDCAAAVRDAHRVLLPGPGVDTHTEFAIPSWQSTIASHAAGDFLQGKASRPTALVDQNGLYFRRPRPQCTLPLHPTLPCC